MFARVKVFFANSILNLRHRDNSIFWASQLAVIISTVFGVYLASTEGLKSAVQFHAITELEQKYFMLNSLRQEIERNNNLILEFCDNGLVRDETGEVTALRSQIPLELNWFVWDLMLETERTLTIPTEVLFGVKDYIEQVKELLNEYEEDKRRRLYTGIQLYELASKTNEKIINRMDAEMKRYQKSLAPYQTFKVH